MTVSFHKYGDFFPGTGALADVGAGAGAKYSVNVPLQEGMDDESYRYVFEPIMQKVCHLSIKAAHGRGCEWRWMWAHHVRHAARTWPGGSVVQDIDSQRNHSPPRSSCRRVRRGVTTGRNSWCAARR